MRKLATFIPINEKNGTADQSITLGTDENYVLMSVAWSNPTDDMINTIPIWMQKHQLEDFIALLNISGSQLK